MVPTAQRLNATAVASQEASAPLPEDFSVMRLLAFSRLAALVLLALFLLGPALLFNVRQFVERDQVLADEVLIFSRVLASLPQSREVADSAQQEVWRNVAVTVFGTEVGIEIATADNALVLGARELPWPTTSYEGQFTTAQGTHVHVTLQTSLRDRLPWMVLFVVVSLLLYVLALQMLDKYLFTPWRRAERGRLQAIERVRDIAAISTDWFWETDSLGRLCLLTLAAPVQQQLGRAPLGLCFWELPGMVPEGGWTACRLAMSAQKSFTIRYQIRTAVGVLSHEMRGKPFHDSKGVYQGYRGAGRDISADVARERELARHRDELTQLVDEQTAHLLRMSRDADVANRAKSMFLATMSHEIRTPLNSIIGLTYLAQQAASQEDRDRHLTAIAGAGTMLMSLINDILDLSKIEAGKLVLETLPFEVQTLLDEAVGMMKARIDAKGLQLNVRQDCDVRRELLGDRHRLLQVLVNFLSNAVKFTERGEVGIRVACVELPDGALELRLEVSDTGIGLSREQQARVFLPFDQATSGTTRQYGGTGLGLAIVKSLADLMRGQVGVFSEPGKGATFWFTARVGQGKPVAALPPADAVSMTPLPDGRPLAGRRILAVDDDALHLRVLREILSRKGALVVAAQTIEEALEAVNEHRHFDMALLDIYLARQSGLELAQRLSALNLMRAVPILAVSASASAEERERCRAAGMKDLIAKPFSASSLLARILPWLPPANPAEARAQAPSLPLKGPDGRETSALAPALQETLEALLRLLDEGSLDAIELAQQQAVALSVWLGEERTAWDDALTQFEFDGAARLLRQRLAKATPLSPSLETQDA